MTLADDIAHAHPATASDAITDVAPRPQDDFYRYVNGPWHDAYVLPNHRAEVTLLTQLAEKVQDDVVGVITRAATAPHAADDTTGQQIADLYDSFMGEARLEQAAPASLTADLENIRAAANHEQLARVLGDLQAHGVSGAFEVSVATDTVNGRGYVLNLTQGGLGLPAAALYDQPHSAALRRDYATHVQAMLTHAAVTDPAAATADVLRLETNLAAGHTPPDATGRVRNQAHACTAADLAARQDGFPWSAWLEGMGAVPGTAQVRVRPQEFLATLDTWWTSHDVKELKHWLTWRHVHEMAPFGPSEVFNENFRFYGQVLTGSTAPRPRWMRATSFVQTVLGDAVGKRYLDEHFAPHTVQAATRLVAALKHSYRTRLHAADWMRPSTRQAALDKLDQMVFEIGFPDTTQTVTNVRVDPHDLFGNVKRGRAWHLARQLNRLDGPIDRSDWKVPPQAVTAYYRHGLNQVVIPAALLQQPVFDPDGDPARNFALLGSIVSHEMSHAFDSRGSHYDGLGRVREWWAPEDREEFARRTALLIEQYDQYTPAGSDGKHVSGARTLGENIADITGLTVTQNAYALHLHHSEVPAAEDPESMRRFFSLWASMWQAKRTHGRMLERLATDRHAPSEIRCNAVLGHVPAFYDAFDVRPGAQLYIQPESRFQLV